MAKKPLSNKSPKHCRACHALQSENVPVKIVRSLKKFVRANKMTPDMKKTLLKHTRHIVKSAKDKHLISDIMSCTKCDYHQGNDLKYKNLIPKYIPYNLERWNKPMKYNPKRNEKQLIKALEKNLNKGRKERIKNWNSEIIDVD
jgi:hypothetical protein